MAQSIQLTLQEFIKESRMRGFPEQYIYDHMMKKGYPQKEIELAFIELEKQSNNNHPEKAIPPSNNEKNKKGAVIEEKPDNKSNGKKVSNQLCISLDDEILKILEKRAKKNLLTITKQVENIVARSCATSLKKTTEETEKLDDNLVGIFSRKKVGRKPNKKQKKKISKKEEKNIQKVDQKNTNIEVPVQSQKDSKESRMAELLKNSPFNKPKTKKNIK